MAFGIDIARPAVLAIDLHRGHLDPAPRAWMNCRRIMNTKIVIGIAFASLVALFASACSGPSVCARKEKWLGSHCAGTDVAWSHDASCESSIKSCDEAHMAQINGYVACLESQSVCSLDTMAACQAQYPGGVAGYWPRA